MHRSKPGPSRRAPAGGLPETLLIEVVAVDVEAGEALARPLDWRGPAAPPEIRIRAAGPALAEGEQALVRVRREPGGVYTASVLRRLDAAPKRIVAIYRPDANGGRLQSTERKLRTEFALAPGRGPGPGAGGALRRGDLVLADVMPAMRLGLPQARIVERLGHASDPGAASLIAILSHDIPTVFDAAALKAARRARPAPPGGREDLRQLPLVTIDGADARDFDDAVFTEPDAANPGGFHLVVAIADVAWYARAGDALDRAAHERGNSVYFPDRVVPMLPERLSNDLCSLRPREDRPCLAVHIWFDAEGRKRRHKFTRAMIRSAARLTYDEVQEAADGRPQGAAAALSETAIAPLYAAYRALAQARAERGTLDLDLEERKVVLGRGGRVERIVPRLRLDSHRLIEEFMIAANVCAAESLEERRLPCMYRVHDDPDPEKLAALRQVLDGLGFRLARGQVLSAQHFSRILEWAADTPHRNLVNNLVLRCQSLAIYNPENRGHFGLALRRYAHFTSPIRRYADLLVHRALIAGLKLGEGGLPDGAAAVFNDLAGHLSSTERRATEAERDALDRYVAAYLAERTGARFPAHISGVARFGLFVTLDELGADGLVPIRALPDDFYVHDPTRQQLRGRRSARVFALGEAVEVRLVEANPATGGIVFDLLDSGRPGRRRGRIR
ncbi:MAG: ribonuclease R [Pseudomonadota bacterium]